MRRRSELNPHYGTAASPKPWVRLRNAYVYSSPLCVEVSYLF